MNVDMNKQDYIYYKNKKGIVIYHVPSKRRIILDVLNNSKVHEKELLYVGTLKKKDDKFILENIVYMDVYGDENMVIFNPDKQIKFMKYCSLNDYVPFILHTHLNEEDKTFSLPDKSFLEKFSCTYNKLFSKKIVIGALINVQGRKFQLVYIEEDQEYVSCLMNI